MWLQYGHSLGIQQTTTHSKSVHQLPKFELGHHSKITKPVILQEHYITASKIHVQHFL